MSSTKKGFINNILIIASLVVSFALNAKSYDWDDITQPQYLDNLVACETQLQEYKWSKNKWPKANKEAKPAFSTVKDTDIIRQKVLDNLYKQNLLSTQFNFDINQAMLQHDLDRMAHNTKDSKGLKAMYALFDNDSMTIAQCISRPYLVNKKLQNRYNQSTDIHQTTKTQAQLELNDYRANNKTELATAQINTVTFKIKQEQDLDKIAKEPSETNEETIIELEQQEYQQKLKNLENTNLQEKPYGFIYTQILQQTDDSIKVKNLVWQKQSINQWLETQEKVIQAVSYKNNLTLTTITGSSNSFDTKSGAVTGDTWKIQNIPDGRQNHTMVWSGSEVLIWGGHNGSPSNTGGRYNPSTDSWLSISINGAPSGRSIHTAIWTGSQMVVWGGSGFLNSGGRYDPSTDTWLSTSITGAPSGRYLHTAVWDGSKMIIWGGYDGSNYLNSGGLYDPNTDSWLATNITGVPSVRYYHTAVWDGNQMIVWGGYDGSNNLNTGGRYDPNTDSWLATSITGAPSVRYLHTAIWAGNQMIVWGGKDISNIYVYTGGRYDPSTDTWLPTSTTGAPSARILHTAIWSGSQMVVWGGTDAGNSKLDTGGRYNPSNDSWLATSMTGAPSGRYNHETIWSGNEMIVWGGFDNSNLNTGSRYIPSTNSWSATSNSGEPSSRHLHTAVWDGNNMIVWGGLNSNNINTGGRYNPSTDNWLVTSTVSAPSARRYHTAIWSGSQMIVWGGFDDFYGGFVNAGGRYDPITDSWLATSTTGVPSGRYFHTVVWTGSQMIIWGGSGNLNTGSRYDPSTDIWLATSTTGAPSGRYLHTAVWSGSEMILWGGSGNLNTGSRYNPNTDSWLATSIIGTPSGRSSHTVIWTGNQMVVWGGNGSLNTGGRYDPSTDTWLPTSITGAPSGRYSHTAVWSGSEMILWGGNPGLKTGGRYNPDTDSWLLTNTTGAPVGRFNHTAVWNGDEMIVWGGYAGGYLNSIGIYYPTSSYSIGGNLSGLNGNQVILQNNGGDDLTLSADGAFTFANAITEGGSYDVTVLTNPTSPAQTCSVTNGAGMNIMANVTNVQVTCVDNSHNIAVTVTGLDATNSIEVTTNGQSLNFTGPGGPTNFATPLFEGIAYAIQVTADPTSPNQTCSVTGGGNGDGSGTMGTMDVAVTVNCVTNQYNVGVTVSGLASGNNIILQNNLGDDLSVSSNGVLNNFATALIDESSYAITVLTDPSTPNQTCVVDAATASGTLNGASVNVSVVCTTNKYNIGVTVSGLAAGSLVLQNNAGDDLNIATDGAYTFATQLDDLSTYAVTVLTPPTMPNQTCAVTGGDNSDGTGALSGMNDLSVVVTCITNQYAINVTVTGLAATNTISFANSGDTLTISSNTTATLSTLNDGTAYNVMISGNQPDTPTQTCAFTSANTGTLSGANVTITVYCNTELTAVADTYTAFEDITLVANGSVVGVNDGVLVNDTDVDGDTLSVVNPGTISATGLTGDVTIAVDGTFSYVPPVNVSGQDMLSIQVTDGIHIVPSNISIDVLPVNDAPTFTIMGNVLSAELDPNIVNTTLTIAQFATNIDAGAPDESGQTVQFNASIFAGLSVVNAVTLSNTGDLNLDFTGNIGLAIIQLTLQDDGLTTNGGEDTSVVTEFVVSYSDVMFSDDFESTVLLKTQGLFASKIQQIPSKDSVIYQEETDSVKFLGHQLNLNGMDRAKALDLVKSWMQLLLLVQQSQE